MNIISKVKKNSKEEIWIIRLLPDDKKAQVIAPNIDIRIFFYSDEELEYKPTRKGFRIEEKYMSAFVEGFKDFVRQPKDVDVEANFSGFVLPKTKFLMLNNSIYNDKLMKEIRFCTPPEEHITENYEVGTWTNHWQGQSTKEWQRKQGITIKNETAIELYDNIFLMEGPR